MGSPATAAEAAAEERLEKVREIAGIELLSAARAAEVEVGRFQNPAGAGNSGHAASRRPRSRRAALFRVLEHLVGFVVFLELFFGLGSLGLRSGWCLRASFLKALEISSWVAVLDTPRSL
jgi:hypothetical protein